MDILKGITFLTVHQMTHQAEVYYTNFLDPLMDGHDGSSKSWWFVGWPIRNNYENNLGLTMVGMAVHNKFDVQLEEQSELI